jgi:hypothetical protein
VTDVPNNVIRRGWYGWDQPPPGKAQPKSDQKPIAKGDKTKAK